MIIRKQESAKLLQTISGVCLPCLGVPNQQSLRRLNHRKVTATDFTNIFLCFVALKEADQTRTFVNSICPCLI